MGVQKVRHLIELLMKQLIIHNETLVNQTMNQTLSSEENNRSAQLIQTLILITIEL